MTSTVLFNEFERVTREPPRVIVPETAAVFSHRATRFAQLANGHALGDWLRFLGHLSRAQHEALQVLPAVPLPEAVALKFAHTHRMPPLGVDNWQRDPIWHDLILALLLDAACEQIPEAGRAALNTLRTASVDRLEDLARQVLTGHVERRDVAVLPVIGAALQVYWTHMAASLGASRVPPLDAAGVCPCCGSLPVASIVRRSGDVESLRYLHCSLCNTEWNFVRVKCAVCETTEGIAYQGIEGNAPHVRAETCDGCKSYLKIVNADQEPAADVVADDLASLALDFLADEAGYVRSGNNLFLVPGPVEQQGSVT